MRNVKMTIWIVITVVIMMAKQGFGVLVFNDGEIHNIDYAIVNHHVRVDYEAPGVQTTLNLLDGSSITEGYHLNAMNNSLVNILGGTVGGSVNAWDSSYVTFSGGSIELGFFGYGNSKITMSGGTVNGTSALGTLHAGESSQIAFYGGRVNGYLFARENSRIDWSGGTVSNDIRLGHNAVLTIYGSDFKVDGIPVSDNVINSIQGGDLYNETYRRLTGILAKGEILNNQFRVGGVASIVLVPEPATLLLLGLGVVILRSKR